MNRRDIFIKAWVLVRTYALDLATALKKAWAWYKIRKAMQNNVVEFYYKKADGTLRQAFGTLRSDLVGAVKGTGRKAPEYLQTYWDTEKQEYRSFKVVNLATI